MFTGAIAASYYGTPRTTMDVDIVVKVSEKNVQPLLLEPLRKAGMQVDERKIKAALKSGYNIVTVKDKKTTLTVDVIFSDEKLMKKSGTIAGLPTFYQTPEELILSKLRMIKVTMPPERAVKDKDDVRAVLKHTKVNVKAIEKRAQRENTLTIFKELMRERENILRRSSF